MELYNLENGRVLLLTPGTATTVGRGPDSGISSTAVSRSHCTVSYALINSCDSSGAQGTASQAREPEVLLTVLHAAGAAVIRGAQARQLGLDPLLLLPARASCQLYPGDKVYLERKDARLASGLELRRVHGSHGNEERGGEASGAPPILEPSAQARTPAPAPPPAPAPAVLHVPWVAPPACVAQEPLPAPLPPQQPVAAQAAPSPAPPPPTRCPDGAAGGPGKAPEADQGAVQLVGEGQLQQQGQAGATAPDGAADALDGAGDAMALTPKRQRLTPPLHEPQTAACCPPSSAAPTPPRSSTPEPAAALAAAAQSPPPPSAAGESALETAVRTTAHGGASAAVLTAAPPPVKSPRAALELTSMPQSAAGAGHEHQHPPPPPLQQQLQVQPLSELREGHAAPSDLPSSAAPKAAAAAAAAVGPEPPHRKRRRSASPLQAEEPPVAEPASGPAGAGTAAAAAAPATRPPPVAAFQGLPTQAAEVSERVPPAAGPQPGGEPPAMAAVGGSGLPAATALPEGTPSAPPELRGGRQEGGAAAPAPAGPEDLAAAAPAETHGSVHSGGAQKDEGPAVVPVEAPSQRKSKLVGGLPLELQQQQQGEEEELGVRAEVLREGELLGEGRRSESRQPSELQQQQQGEQQEQEQEQQQQQQGEPMPPPPPQQQQQADPQRPTVASQMEPRSDPAAPSPRQGGPHAPPLAAEHRASGPVLAEPVPAAAAAAAVAAAPAPALTDLAASRDGAATATAAAPSTHGGIGVCGRPRAGGGTGGGSGGIFRGCRFVFWARSQARDVLVRVKQAGGQEQYSLGPGTTHVVARYDITAEEASRLLRASDLEYDTAAASSYLPPGILFVTPQYLRHCLAKGQRVNPDPDPAAGHLISLAIKPPTAPPARTASHPPSAPQPPPPSPPPPQKRRDATGAAAPPATTSPRQRQQEAAQRAESPSSRRTTQGHGEAAAGAEGGPAAQQHPHQPPLTAPLDRSPGGAAAAAPPPPPAEQEGRLGAVVAAAAAGGSGGGDRVLPGPDEVCARPEEWGVGNRWIEPWDPEAAARTCMLILTHWAKHSYQSEADPTSPGTLRVAGAGGAGESVGDVALGRRRRRRSSSGSSGTETSEEEGQGRVTDGGSRDAGGGGGGGDVASAGAAAERINGVCSHRCCAARPFCILSELKRTRDLYMGREDQFRIKAVDRAMGILVTEILATGRFHRNDTYEQNEKRMTMMRFMQVWGCGESTARSWWTAGARSLDNVRQRADLTVQQRLGLRHFDDFQLRIPRAEVDEVVAVVRQTTIDALRALTQLPDAALLDRLHVRPMGSFVRGSTSSSDVDFIIAPSPQADPRVSPYALLVSIVERLEAGGYLDPESARLIETRQDHFRSPHKPPPVRPAQLLTHGSADTAPSGAESGAEGGPETAGGSGGARGRRPGGHKSPRSPGTVAAARSSGTVESATWLGVWHSPSSGRYRRIDIKCYTRRLLATAVCYFSSGMDFNRALRYWAGAPTPQVRELARRVHPRADAFRLSDKELAVVERRGAPPQGGVVDVILATVPCSNETDIFQALGLDYVPPHMRDITRVEGME
ncbi:hypothetical protein PLESTF_001233200 [Pleodorina starrii]|nr:hypothetical protein PLESTM_000376300 [Pleodorina starrii]GLC72304.1 hypothetical protein PLESTF_001233200 [Pleodorina starrii]